MITVSYDISPELCLKYMVGMGHRQVGRVMITLRYDKPSAGEAGRPGQEGSCRAQKQALRHARVLS